MKRILIIGMLLLFIASTGCTDSGSQSGVSEVKTVEKSVVEKTTTPSATTKPVSTQAPTTSPPSTTTPLPEKSALETIIEKAEEAVTSKIIDTNPKYKVLAPSDIGNSQFYDVTESIYETLDDKVERGMKKESYDILKESEFIESYKVKYTLNDENLSNSISIWEIEVVLNRYKDKGGAQNHLEYAEDYYNSEETFEPMIGKEFGDKVVYATTTFIKINTAIVQVENFLIYFSTTGGELSDMYPYIEILVNRLTSDEEVQPPEVTT